LFKGSKDSYFSLESKKNFEPQYWLVGSDDHVIKISAKHTSMKIPWTPNPNLNTLAPGWFRRFSQKNSSFRLPYQRPISFADCAGELFNGSSGLAGLV